MDARGPRDCEPHMHALNRLTIARKYLLIGLLVLIMMIIPTSMVVFQQAETARKASAIAEHLAPATQMLEVVRLSQQARGLSNGFLNGNDSAANDVRNALDALRTAFDKAERSLHSVGASEDLKSRLTTLAGQIRDLASRVQSRAIPAPASFATYTDIIDAQMSLLRDIAADTGLNLDDNPITFPLINGLFTSLPPLTEYLGQARGMSAGLLARGAASEAEKQRVAALHALSLDRQQAWEASLSSASRLSAEVSAALSSPTQRAVGTTLKALDLTRREIMEATRLTHSSPAYFQAMTEPIDAHFALGNQTATLLENMLNSRAQQAYIQLWILLAALTLSGGLAFWLAYVLTRNTISSLRTSLRMAQTIAQGDLTLVAKVNGTDETQQLLQALNEMSASLVGIISQVRGSSDNIATAASQIAAGNHDLADRTTAQAASLEETAASMEQLTSTVTQNSENAVAAHTLTSEATDVAERGSTAVQQFVETMSTIRETSANIADIVGIIDGIAFQTNILALNAAVEAARAGEAGKGFAVVAAEVRSLAQRSATSAREIRDLISQSTSEVDAGARLADAAGTTMRELLESISRVGDIMSEIAVASKEQSYGIGQVNVAVGQMDGVTQQNAALVQEARAAADSLHEQSSLLVEAVRAFKLPSGNYPATADTASHARARLSA